MPFLRSVELNAQRHLIGAEYAIAVIESALYFEAWLRRLLRQRFIEISMTELEADQKFTDGSGQPRSIWWIAKNLVPEAYGADFLSTPEGVEWAHKAKDLRNRLVHGEQEKASAAEAHGAYEAVANACKVIRAMAAPV